MYCNIFNSSVIDVGIRSCVEFFASCLKMSITLTIENITASKDRQSGGPTEIELSTTCPWVCSPNKTKEFAEKSISN
jgi:hypothetical protein